MRDHGKKTILISLIASFISFCLATAQESHCYYLCAYENDAWGTNILFEKVNLDSNTIVVSQSIALGGEIQFKTPIPIARGGSTYYLVTTIDGLPAKNATARNQKLSRYALVSGRGEVITTGEISGVQLLKFTTSPNGAVEINYIDSAGSHLWGNLAIDDFRRIAINNSRREIADSTIYPTISRFRYFKRIDQFNDRLFWNVIYEGTYILKIDLPNRTLIDSLRIGNRDPYNHIFGLSQNDSILYSFNVNYNTIGGPQSLVKNSIDPCFVKRYNSFDFSLLDSIPFQYPSLDLGYVGSGSGPCDRIGPYFVYYFFTGEDYRYFSPAMLFIFDTRSNEARWLRVGWR